MSFQRAIYDDAISTYLKTLIDNAAEDSRIAWTTYQADVDGKGKIYKVYEDLQEQLPYTPSIEICADSSDNEIFSIGTQEQKFNFDIIVTVAQNHPEASSKYLRIVASTVFDLLNDFNNRSFTVPGYTFNIYYSEATSIEYKFRRGKGLRSAVIKWYGKLLKPNRTTLN